MVYKKLSNIDGFKTLNGKNQKAEKWNPLTNQMYF